MCPDAEPPLAGNPDAASADPANLIDPKLQQRALKHMQNLVKGNGIKASDVTLEDCQAQIYNFPARTFVKLRPLYGMRLEPGQNRKAELVASQDEFKWTLDKVTAEARTNPAQRKIITDYIFSRPDKGFGLELQKFTFHKLERDYTIHEGCNTCAKIGKIKCARCGADGVLMCPTCQGRTLITCPQCRSTGKVAQGNGHRACDRCHGQGRIKCTGCQGKGRIRCPACAAKGMTACKKCAGTGWMSHIAHVDIEARFHFDFNRHGLPPEVVKTIEAQGSRLIMKGDLEVGLGNRSIMPGPDAPETEPDDMIFIDYAAKIPHGPVLFRLKDRPVAATLFGYHGRLNEAPRFLDDLTKKGQQVLAEAAAGNGDVADKIHRAARYRLLCDIIVQAAGRTRQRKALAALTHKYPVGIAPEQLLKLLVQSELALKLMTRKPRLVGLGAGFVISAALTAAYFLGGGRHYLATKGMTDIVLTGLDLMPILVGTGVMTALSLLFAMMAQKKALLGLSQARALKRLPKPGKLVWVAFAASWLSTGAILVAAGLMQPEHAPAWVLNALSHF